MDDQLIYNSPVDIFGTFRSYKTVPERDPFGSTTLEDVSDIPDGRGDVDLDDLPPTIRWLNRSEEEAGGEWGPLENETSFLLTEWFTDSAAGKSLESFDALLNILKSKNFKQEHIATLNAHSAMRNLDNYKKASGIFSRRDGWNEAEIDIALPKPGRPCASEADAPRYKVAGLQFRKLLEVIIGEIQDRRFATKRNWIPHKTYWLPPRNPMDPPDAPAPPPIRVFSDTFDTDSMNEADAAIRARPRNPGDPPSLEYGILPMCIWSDGTCLATFGSASLWPIYLYIANISKYIRGKPTEFVAQHLAYIPTVSLIPSYDGALLTHHLSCPMRSRTSIGNSSAPRRQPTHSGGASVNLCSKYGC